MEGGRRGEGEEKGSGGFLLISCLPSARPFLHSHIAKVTKKGGEGDVVQFLKREDWRQREKRKGDLLSPSLLCSAKAERLKKRERGKRKQKHSAESFHSMSAWEKSVFKKEMGGKGEQMTQTFMAHKKFTSFS